MSKQYLTIHTDDEAHPTDIFSLTSTATSLLSVSGASSLQVHSIKSLTFPCTQTVHGAHKVGSHHIASSNDGRTALSVGFGGQIKVWALPVTSEEESSRSQGEAAQWQCRGQIKDGITGKKAGEAWAVAADQDGRYLASTTADGRVNVWDLGVAEIDSPMGPNQKDGSLGEKKIREFETKGSFGLCIDLSPEGALTATGHASGTVYLFNNETSRLTQALPSLHAPVRTVRFSPGGTLLAAAGDGCVIHLFSPTSGEHLALLSGHNSWIFSLAFSDSGAHLLSGAWDGRVKVWDVERRDCVWTGRGPGEEGPVWSVSWLKGRSSAASSAQGKSQGFVVGGRGGLRFYREAAGG